MLTTYTFFGCSDDLANLLAIVVTLSGVIDVQHGVHLCSATNIILITYNLSFLSICLILSLESTVNFLPSITSYSLLYLWFAFPAATTSSCADLPVSPSVALLCFHYRLLICLFRKYFHRRLSPGLGTDSTDFVTGVFYFWASGFCF